MTYVNHISCTWFEKLLEDQHNDRRFFIPNLWFRTIFVALISAFSKFAPEHCLSESFYDTIPAHAPVPVDIPSCTPLPTEFDSHLDKDCDGIRQSEEIECSGYSQSPSGYSGYEPEEVLRTRKEVSFTYPSLSRLSISTKPLVSCGRCSSRWKQNFVNICLHIKLSVAESRIDKLKERSASVNREPS